MTTFQAFFMGFLMVIRRPLLPIIKWVLNICFAALMMLPLAKHFDEQLSNVPLDMAPFREHFAIQYVVQDFSEFLKLFDLWPAYILLFAAFNLFLSGGLLNFLQREGRIPLKQFLPACIRCLPYLILGSLLCLCLGLVLVLVPIYLFETFVIFVRDQALSATTMMNIAWGMIGVVALIGLVFLGISRKHLSAKALRFQFAVFLGIISGLMIALLTYGRTYITHLAEYWPNHHFLMNLYWIGFAIILITVGSLSVRIYDLTRLLICRGRDQGRGEAAPSIVHTLASFWKASKFTVIHHVETFVIFYGFIGLQLLLYPVFQMFENVYPERSQHILVGQVFLIFRISFSLAGLGAQMSLFQKLNDKKEVDNEDTHQNEVDNEDTNQNKDTYLNYEHQGEHQNEDTHLDYEHQGEDSQHQNEDTHLDYEHQSEDSQQDHSFDQSEDTHQDQQDQSEDTHRQQSEDTHFLSEDTHGQNEDTHQDQNQDTHINQDRGLFSSDSKELSTENIDKKQERKKNRGPSNKFSLHSQIVAEEDEDNRKLLNDGETPLDQQFFRED